MPGFRPLACRCPGRITVLLAMAVLTLGAVSCRKKEDPPKKPRKLQEILTTAHKERQAVRDFAEALREMLEWRQTLPVPLSEQDRGQIVRRMAQIPAPDDLPEPLALSWRQLLQFSQILTGEKPGRRPTQQEGADAAAELNRQLALHGYGDLRF